MVRNLCNAVDAVAFVKFVRKDCETIANGLEITLENVIGLAAEESEYGRGRIAKEYNNYFSMHAPAPFQMRSEPARNDAKVQVAVFDLFSKCAQSFASTYGPSIRGKSDPDRICEGTRSLRVQVR